VSVIIPTVDRYPYLRTLLGQLRRQTLPPREIIVIDQTDSTARDQALAADFSDLPLRVIALDRAGQCSSRNAGLAAARGDHILFIDDDDEIQPDLIARHVANLAGFQAEVSCGTAEEAGAGPLPPSFTFTRLSDVFPTNNSLIQKDVLRRSGLFDLAYEKMPRADGDLGMRLYLSGARMMYNPDICVFHHHAPRGGLRTHKARVITYASSRAKLLHRKLPSPSEVYLGLRYFTPAQVRESLWLAALGTFAVRGSLARKLIKALIGLVLLPDTAVRIRRAAATARAMLADYPQIPTL
jgi:glycosyltransferase involved in cell wall biosynthesis